MTRFGCIDTGSALRDTLEFEFTISKFSPPPLEVSWGWDSDLVVFQADQSAEERASSSACSSAMSSAESKVFWASFIALLAIDANLVVSNQLMMEGLKVLWATKLKDLGASSAKCKS